MVVLGGNGKRSLEIVIRIRSEDTDWTSSPFATCYIRRPRFMLRRPNMEDYDDSMDTTPPSFSSLTASTSMMDNPTTMTNYASETYYAQLTTLEFQRDNEFATSESNPSLSVAKPKVAKKDHKHKMDPDEPGISKKEKASRIKSRKSREFRVNKAEELNKCKTLIAKLNEENEAALQRNSSLTQELISSLDDNCMLRTQNQLQQQRIMQLELQLQGSQLQSTPEVSEGVFHHANFTYSNEDTDQANLMEAENDHWSFDLDA